MADRLREGDLGIDALRTIVSGRISLMAPFSSAAKTELEDEEVGCLASDVGP
jgi:hypothetical protein